MGDVKLCQICGENPLEEMCPDCNARGCGACLDGHFCITSGGDEVIRTWQPLPTDELRAIIADTEQDDPPRNYCPDDVYRLAREVERSRHLLLAAAGFIAGSSLLSKETMLKQLADAIRPTMRREQPAGLPAATSGGPVGKSDDEVAIREA